MAPRYSRTASRDRRTRRRGRREQALPLFLVAVAVVVVLFLVIGGIVKIGSASRPYWRSIDRSYAAQAAILTTQSNDQAQVYHREVPALPAQSRTTLGYELDDLVATQASLAQQADELSPPGTEGGADNDLQQALDDREQAVEWLRASVEGYLGMHPATIVGAPAGTIAGTVPQGAGAPATGNEATAEARLTTADRLLAASDRAYAKYRRVMRDSAGHPTAAASVWAQPKMSTQGFATGLVGEIAQAKLLSSVPQVVLAGSTNTAAIRMVPAAVPTVVPAGAAQPTPGSSVTVPPTHTLTVTATFTNTGNVDESEVTVRAQVFSSPTQVVTVSRKISLAASDSVSRTFPTLPVKPGNTYVLRVSVVPPPGQAPDVPRAAMQFQVDVAPLG